MRIGVSVPMSRSDGPGRMPSWAEVRQLHAGVRTAAVLRAQPPERLEAIRAAMADVVRGYADGDAFPLPIAARLISARA